MSQHSTSTPASLTRQAAGLVLLLGLGCLTACTAQGGGNGGPVDLGSMAYPEPLPQGVISRTVVSGTAHETGNNMAYPEPLPQGVISTTRIR